MIKRECIKNDPKKVFPCGCTDCRLNQDKNKIHYLKQKIKRVNSMIKQNKKK